MPASSQNAVDHRTNATSSLYSEDKPHGKSATATWQVPQKTIIASQPSKIQEDTSKIIFPSQEFNPVTCTFFTAERIH